MFPCEDLPTTQRGSRDQASVCDLNELDTQVQLLNLERYKEHIGGDAGVAKLVELLLSRVSPGRVLFLCVGEQVIAQVSSLLDAKKSFETLVTTRLAQEPKNPPSCPSRRVAGETSVSFPRPSSPPDDT